MPDTSVVLGLFAMGAAALLLGGAIGLHWSYPDWFSAKSTNESFWISLAVFLGGMTLILMNPGFWEHPPFFLAGTDAVWLAVFLFGVASFLLALGGTLSIAAAVLVWGLLTLMRRYRTPRAILADEEELRIAD